MEAKVLECYSPEKILLLFIYSGNQSGLFYENIPNNAYVSREKAIFFSGANIIKEKDFATLMFYTIEYPKTIPTPPRLHLCLHVRLHMKILLFIQFISYIFYNLSFWFVFTSVIHCLFHTIFCSWDYFYFYYMYVVIVSLLNTSHCVASLVLFLAA